MLQARWLGRRNWWDSISPEIILGALPFARDVSAMAAAGVRAVVNTCEEYAGPVSEYQKHGIEQFRMPTTDFTHPKFEAVCAAVEFIERQVAENKTVYIHCKAGRARSATVAACYLIKSRQITADAAQLILSEKRPHVNPRLAARPVVQQFEQTFLCE